MAKKDILKETKASAAAPQPRARKVAAPTAAVPTVRHRSATRIAALMVAPTEAQVAELAYLIYKARCMGNPEADWMVAESYLKAQRA